MLPIPATNLWLNVAVLAVSVALLSRSAGFLVDGSVGIATRLRVPKLVIGIILVSFATTAPEFTVTVLASMDGIPKIVVGNAVGSIIADNGLALALGVILAPAATLVDRKTVLVLGGVLLAVALLCFAFIANDTLSRPEGFVLLVLLVAYVVYLLLDERNRRRKDGPIAEEVTEEVEEHVKPGGVGLQSLRFAVGIVGLVIGSRLLIDTAVNIAHIFSVSEAVIGLTIVAVGTSLPEIATSVVAFRRGHGDLAFGDIMGANLLNILWIIGAAAAIHPITVSRKVILFSFPVMISFVVILVGLAAIKFRFDRWKGFVLLGCYMAYLAATLVLFYGAPG